MQNILRKYPSKYNFDGMFLDLVVLLDHATESDSKEAAVWILAEYAEEIYNVSMATFKKWINSFESEERRVQLEILSSAVKVYLKYPDEFETLISDLLTIATETVSNPDVRDRAFIYWRMLSTDPEKTKTVVFGYRPQAKDTDKLVDQNFLSEMMKSLGYVNSLFEKKPEELFQRSLAETKVAIDLCRVSGWTTRKSKLHPSQKPSPPPHRSNRPRLPDPSKPSSPQLSQRRQRRPKKWICLICCEPSLNIL
jgi:vesicle coat complex subunit